jgi:hypothetical protein
MSNWKARLLVGFMLVAMMLATVAGPALANDGKNDNDNNHHNNGFNVFDDNDNNHNDFDHNNDFLVFNNDDDFDDFDHFNNDINDDFFFSPFTTFGFANSCPFWGDFEGPVNQFDCFD